MKYLSKLAFILLGGVIMFMTSCGDDGNGDPEPEPGDSLAIEGSWSLDSVSANESEPNGDWSNFTLTVNNDSSYETSNPASTEVWPESGSLDIGSDADFSAGADVTRSPDDVSMNMTVDGNLTITFEITDESSARSQIVGNWEFIMSK